MRWRITIRGDAPKRVELRGYADLPYAELVELSNVLKPYGIVMASQADDDYDPFAETEDDQRELVRVRRELADAKQIMVELYRRLA